MRRLWTLEQLRDEGATRAQLRTGERRGRWTRAAHGVYADGAGPVSRLDVARAETVSADGVANGTLAGVLHALDGVTLKRASFDVPPGSSNHRPGARRRRLSPDAIVVIEGVRCLDAFHTLLDLAAEVDDLVWEQALESALRRGLTTIGALESAALTTFDGVERIRRVLARRPVGAPATESLLETLFVQLARNVAGLGDPLRQYTVLDEEGRVIARVDLAWPELGVFIELDGQHHLGQPVHDARRETAVVGATGWLCGRFTWHEVVRLPRTTTRRLAAVAEQGRRRVARVGRNPAASASEGVY